MNRPSNWAFIVARAFLARATSPVVGGDDDYHPVLATRIYVRYETAIKEVARYLQQKGRGDALRKFLEE